MINNFSIDKYHELLIDASLWEEKADYLYKSAELLRPNIDAEWDSLRRRKLVFFHYLSIYYMLSSFVIENLLKALIIKNNEKHIKNSLSQKNRLPDCLDSHDLLELAKKADLKDVAEEEKLLLKKLSNNAIWEGRYPVPREPGNYDNRVTFYTNDDCEWIKKLIKEIKIILNKNSK